MSNLCVASYSSSYAQNDELYGLLNTSATGKLQEEVRLLRKAVGNLHAALEGA